MHTTANSNHGTALVTGANSGIGFETAYQLAKAGYNKVILGCRSLAKGETARQQLIEKGCADVFETLAIDTAEVDSAVRAGEELVSGGHSIDLLILNAGMSTGNKITKNSTGVDMTFASTLVGHHALTMYLLEHGGISDQASIIIAGSEGARGDVPGIKIPDLDHVARNDFNGNMHDTLKAFAEARYPTKYVPMNAYAMAKVFVAWWASALAEKLPNGQTVYAVSPGSVTSTGFVRHQSWAMKNMMVPLMTILGPMMGMAGPVSAAAKRYLEVSGFGKEQSGKFFASPPKKLVGKLQEQQTNLIADKPKRALAYELIVELTNGMDYQS